MAQQQQQGAIDPNIGAILQQQAQQHQADHQALVQRDQALLAEQQRLVQLQQNKAAVDKRTNWVKKEAKKIDSCDGSTTRGVREWLRAVNGAVHRIPAGADVNAHIHDLIEATTSHDLNEEYEVFMNAAPNRANVAHAAAINHMSTAFLGPEETATLKEDVRSARQSAREDLPAFNRRFKKAAEMAFPQLPRAPDVEEDLADWYMGGLCDRAVKDFVFGHNPRLVTLAAAQTAAYEEWARQARRKRVEKEQRNHRREEPMDISVATEAAALVSSEPPLREVISGLTKQMKELKSELQAMKATPNNAQASSNQPTTRRRTSQNNKSSIKPVGPCFRCRKEGHHVRDCWFPDTRNKQGNQ